MINFGSPHEKSPPSGDDEISTKQASGAAQGRRGDIRNVEQELKQRNKELQTLLEVSQRLTGRLDLEALLAAVARAVVETLDAAEAASLWLADEAHRNLAACAWAGHDEAAFAGLTVSAETSLVGRVFQSRQPYVTEDTTREPAFEPLHRPALDAVRSVLGVPLLVEENAIGALFADNFSRPCAFDAHDVRLLQSLANQAATAIHQAQLFQQIQHEIATRKQLEREILRISDEERSRIGRDLHDVLGSHLTGATMLAQSLALDAREGLPISAEALSEIARLVREGANQARALAHGLNPVKLEQMGLEAALQALADTTQAGALPACSFEGPALLPALNKTLATQVYRIAQEALTNAIRHAAARHVRIRLACTEDTLILTIRDDGVGLPATPPPETGVGHAIMAYRASLVGGFVTVENAPDEGTLVTCSVPIVEASSPGSSPND